MKKRLLIFSIFLFLATSLYAKIKIAPEAGFNFSLYTYNLTNPTYYASHLPNSSGATIYLNYRVGCNFEFPINEKFSFQTAANYVRSSWEMKRIVDYRFVDPYYLGNGIDPLDTPSIHVTMQTIEIPFLLMVRPIKSRWFIGFGPHLGINIAAFQNYKDTHRTTDVSLNIGQDRSLIKRFDLGAGIVAGYELKNGFYFKGGFNAALGNLIPSSRAKDDGNIYHGNFFITAGRWLRHNVSSSK